jgi:hypothetical protein
MDSGPASGTPVMYRLIIALQLPELSRTSTLGNLSLPRTGARVQLKLRKFLAHRERMRVYGMLAP